MAEYQLVASIPGNSVPHVQRMSDGAFIPFDPANRDFAEYSLWLAEGNTPDPAPEPLTTPEPEAVLNFPSAGLTVGQAFTSGNVSWVWDGAKWTANTAAAVSPRYIVACFVPGLMTANQILLDHRVSKAVTFPANFGTYLGHTSEGRGSANATASTAIDVERALSASPASFSSVGTITIASGAMVATFASSGGTAVTFAQGDTLALVGPATPDATFAGFAATLVGYET